MYGVLKVADVPKEYQDTITAVGITIKMTKQRTGFGYRRYFLCPTCNRKCGKVHLRKERLYCQQCTPLDLYGYRQGLYDEGGTALIIWHMKKLVKTISDKPIKWPFHYFDYLLEKPQGMSNVKYRDTLMKLQILENMRFSAIFFRSRFRAADIKRYTHKAFIDLFELWQVAEYIIFSGVTSPEDFSFLLDDDVFRKRFRMRYFPE